MDNKTKFYKQSNIYKICILGAGGVGKSCITLRFMKNKFIDYYDPTIYDCYKRIFDFEGRKYFIEINDTAGQEEYNSIIDQYIIESNAFVIVFSLEDINSFDEIVKFYDKIKLLKEESNIVIVGNKCDLVQIISDKSIDELSKKLNVKYVKCSALDNINIELIFTTLLKQNNKEKTKSKNKCILL